MISQSKFEGELQEFIKPLLDKHHVTRNHKTKFHFVLACYLSRSITQHIISILPKEIEISKGDHSCTTCYGCRKEGHNSCLSIIKKLLGIK